MQKEKITKAEILKDYGFKLQIMKGYIDTEAQPEILLPAGTILEKPCTKPIQKNADSEVLLPAGFTKRPDGSVELPNERSKRQSAENQNRKPPVDESDLLLPAGVKLEDR